MVSGILKRPTLILNRCWQPVRVADVARSLVLVFNGTALVVDPESFATYDWTDWSTLEPRPDEPFIQAVNQRFRVPEVVTLLRYDRQPNRGVAFSRRNLFRRDGYTCQYCGARPGPQELTVDHIVPKSRGGKTSWENCVLACVSCNSRKADRTVQQSGLRLRKTPLKPRWNPLYVDDIKPIRSWSKFLSEAYWSVELT